MAIPGMSCILGGPIWGGIADKTGKHRCVNIYCIVITSLSTLSMQFVSLNQYFLMGILVAVSSFHLNPILPLLDQAIMAMLTHHDNGDYGRQRLFGSIGAGMGALVCSEVVKHFGIASIFIVQCIASFIAVLALVFLPDCTKRNDDRAKSTLTSSSGMDDLELEAVRVSSRSLMDGSTQFSYLLSLKQLAQASDVVFLFVVVLLLGTMHAVLGSFLGLFMFNLSHGDPNIVGVSALVQTVAELPAFFYSDAIVRRMGTSWVLGLAMIAFGIRLVAYSIIPSAWYMLPVDLLHGLTFSLAWAACTIYAYQAAPSDMHGTMLGLLAALFHGFGRGLGNLIGGWIYDHYGPVLLWRWTALLAPIGILVVAVFHNRQSPKRANNTRLQMESYRRSSPFETPM